MRSRGAVAGRGPPFRGEPSGVVGLDRPAHSVGRMWMWRGRARRGTGPGRRWIGGRGEPLRAPGPDGERSWYMQWDPDNQRWVAQNRDYAPIGAAEPGIKAQPVSTQAEFDAYVAGLPSRSPSHGSPAARAYRQAKAGAPERLLTTPEGTVWADGLLYDPARGGIIAEAKFVDSPGVSVYEGTANPPPFVTEQI